jgi:hypothetical protein
MLSETRSIELDGRVSRCYPPALQVFLIILVLEAVASLHDATELYCLIQCVSPGSELPSSKAASTSTCQSTLRSRPQGGWHRHASTHAGRHVVDSLLKMADRSSAPKEPRSLHGGGVSACVR